MGKRRTVNQNDWMHVVFREVAAELAVMDYDMREVKVEIHPTEELVKEAMFKPIMRAMYPEVKSTTELTTVQMNQLMDVFRDALQDRLGIYIELPEEKMYGDH